MLANHLAYGLRLTQVECLTVQGDQLMLGQSQAQLTSDLPGGTGNHDLHGNRSASRNEAPA